MIGFLTDFGLDGAAAICRGVMLSIARDAQIVDISHTVAKFAIGDGAYLLRSAVPWLPVGVHVGGRGSRASARIAGRSRVQTARGDVLIGPDNGLLLPAAERLGGIDRGPRPREPRAGSCRRRAPRSTAGTSSRRSAPTSRVGEPFEAAGPPSIRRPSSGWTSRRPWSSRDASRPASLYVDSFGNLRLAGGVAELGAAARAASSPARALALEARRSRGRGRGAGAPALAPDLRRGRAGRAPRLRGFVG